MSTTHAPQFVFGGCPSFFRALCREATRGGADGYFRPGHELKRHVDRLQPDDASDEDWADATEELQRLAFEQDGAAVIAWFVEHFPHCMKLVPKRRRGSFLAGVYAMATDAGYLVERSYLRG